MRISLLGLVLAFTLVSAVDFTVETLHKVDRVGSFAVSSSGQVLYTLRSWDGSKVSNQLVLSSSGNRTLIPGFTSASNPSWTTSGTASSVSFLNSASGISQVQIYDIQSGASYQLTNFPIDVQNMRWFQGGLLLTMSVYPDCATLKCTADRDAEVASRGANTWKLYDSLFVRHWDTWETGKVSHIFVQKLKLSSGTFSLDGEPLDLMKGLNVNSPVPPFGGLEQIDVSPDGKEIAFTGQVVDHSSAWTTGWRTYTVPSTGAQAPTWITPDIRARTQNPAYSPDGKWIAYLAMDRPGFEADRLHINLYNRNTGSTTSLTASVDISFGGIVWNSDSLSLLGDADYFGNHSIFQIPLAHPTQCTADIPHRCLSFFLIANFEVKKLVAEQSNTGLVRSGNQLFFTRDSMKTPADIWFFNLTTDGRPPSLQRLTHENEFLSSVPLSDPIRFKFPGSLSHQVEGWVLPPVGYSPTSSYPVVQLVHGGPQGSWLDDWSYRWNPQLWAAHGYAVYMIDFHGSTGYGQGFTDAISGHWGSYPYWDIMNGTAYVLKAFPWMDSNRVTACGASYGGYMINWIQGHTTFFKALVTHDGIFDTTLGYYATEELWFPEWEFKGTPWQNLQAYDQWNPALWVTNWQTPHLIIHGQHDYRLPVSHGLGAFTVLQRRGIPSQFLYFTEENHWVLNDDNSIKWYHTVLAWLDRWVHHSA